MGVGKKGGGVNRGKMEEVKEMERKPYGFFFCLCEAGRLREDLW